MRRAIVLVLALGTLLVCAGLLACGGQGRDETAPPPADEEASPPDEGASTASGAGLTWDDIPIYAAAKQIQKGGWAIPPAEGDWSKVGRRYYQMADDVNTVAMVSMFYRMEMPKNGWQEMMWMEVQDATWAYYSKNDEQHGALVWVSSDEGRTVFALMRATR